MIHSVKRMSSLNSRYLTRFSHLITKSIVTQEDWGQGWGKRAGGPPTQNKNRARERSGSAHPPERCHLRTNIPSKNFQHGILGGLRLSPRLLLLAVAGASDANCHHEALDSHTECYDTTPEKDKEIGKDRSLRSHCETREKQTQSEPDNFPFNWFKLGIPPTSKLFSN